MKIQALATAATLALTLGTAALPAAAYENGDAQLQGTITSFDGRYDLEVQDASGEVHDVQLHPGTIINPDGLALESGMTVTAVGTVEGNEFDADEIDTPYLNDGSVDPTYESEPSVDTGVVSPYAYGQPYGYVYGNAYGTPYGYGYAAGRPSGAAPVIVRPATSTPAHAVAPAGRRVPFTSTTHAAAPVVSHPPASYSTRR